MPRVNPVADGYAQPLRGERYDRDVPEIDDQRRRAERQGEPRSPADERVEMRIPLDRFDHRCVRAHGVALSRSIVRPAFAGGA